MDRMFKQMSGDMQQKLFRFYEGLSPTPPPAPQEQLQRQQAMRAEYERTQRNAELLREAYQRKQTENRDNHNNRIQSKRTAASKRPESASKHRQTAQPAATQSLPSA